MAPGYVHRMAALAALAASALVAAACGAGSDAPEEEQVRQQAALYLRALAAGDPELCSLVTASELARIELTSRATDVPSCEEGAGEPLNAGAIEEAADEIDQAPVEIDDDRALVILTTESGETSERPYAALLAREDGRWKVDDYLP